MLIFLPLAMPITLLPPDISLILAAVYLRLITLLLALLPYERFR